MEQMARNAIDETSGQPAAAPLHSAGSRHEVLLLFSNDFGKRQHRMSHPAAAQSKPQCVCRTMGAIRQAGVSFQPNPVWGVLVAASLDGISGVLSYRTQSPGQG